GLAAVPVPDPRAPGLRSEIRTRAEPPDPADPLPGCRFQRSCPFATEVCREGAPPPTVAAGADGHTVACHHADSPGLRAALSPKHPSTDDPKIPVAPHSTDGPATERTTAP
ncbi:ABC transporter ATP-binding protein, partial [Streptomyces sp. McG3]|nr:ABC transporter ATP-binding protein [Streptomyces sp. McG3]